MKTKKIKKKLVLKKRTVANLDGNEMKHIKGMLDLPEPPSINSRCQSFCPHKCPTPPNSQQSYCLCTTIDIQCNTDTTPLASCGDCVSNYC